MNAAIRLNLKEHRPSERLRVQLQDEPYIIFDSGRAGTEPEGREVRLPSGAWDMVTYVVKDEARQVGFVLHRFEVRDA